jgi:hypothetical protein
MKEGAEWIDGETDNSYASRGFIVEKWPCRGGPWLFTDWRLIKEVGGEVPGRSLQRIILNDPLTFPEQ